MQSAPAGIAQPARIDVGALTLLASEALIMSGTAMPVVTPAWMAFVSHNFIEPTVGDGYLNTPVTTPEQFWPFTGPLSMSLDKSTEVGWGILNDQLHALIASNSTAGNPDDPITVFGYSQSSWIAAVEKQVLAEAQATGTDLPPISFVLLSDLIRPNGGVFSRFFGYGMVRWTPVLSEPTGTQFPSYDIARQYDFFADFPTYPLNLLADLNAVFGLLNHDYSSVTINPADPNYDPNTVVQQYGDTTYYLIPSKLPILDPLRWVGLGQVADAIDPVLRVFVELGYDRQTPYGQYTPFKLFHPVDPAKLRPDLEEAAQEAMATMKPVAPQSKQLLPAQVVDKAPVSKPPAPQVSPRDTARRTAKPAGSSSRRQAGDSDRLGRRPVRAAAANTR